jgi:hypothetical protein
MPLAWRMELHRQADVAKVPLNKYILAILANACGLGDVPRKSSADPAARWAKRAEEDGRRPEEGEKSA